MCVHQPLWYLLSHSAIPSTSSALKTPQNTDPDDLEPAAEGDIQMEYSSH